MLMLGMAGDVMPVGMSPTIATSYFAFSCNSDACCERNQRAGNHRLASLQHKDQRDCADAERERVHVRLWEFEDELLELLEKRAADSGDPEDLGQLAHGKEAGYAEDVAGHH
jgi:hypothetical protein